MYEKIKEEIKKILPIVKECPENLQEKCFEVLLTHFLQEFEPQKNYKEITKATELKTLETREEDLELELGLKDFHTKIKRQLKNNEITAEDLNKLYYKEEDKLMPLYEDLGTDQMSKNQIGLTLLTAFENSTQTGEMTFNVEVVRKKCKEWKCYDPSNFIKNYKDYSNLFEEIEKYKEIKDIKLSKGGREEVFKLLKQLSKD